MYVFHVYVYLLKSRIQIYQAYFIQQHLKSSRPHLSEVPDYLFSSQIIRQAMYVWVLTNCTQAQPMFPYFLLMLDASYLSLLASPLALRCENLWDPPNAHTCTIWKSEGVNVPWGKAFINEIQKLKGKSSSFLPLDRLSWDAVLYPSSWETALGNQAINCTCYQGVASLEMYPWTDFSFSPQCHFSSLLLPGIALPENIIAFKLLPQAPDSGVHRYSRHYECSANYLFSSYHNRAPWPNFQMPTCAPLYLKASFGIQGPFCTC